MSTEQELWKDYNETYAVSNFGSIKNKKRNTILSPIKNGQGYHTVNLHKKTKQVHQLVLRAFIGEPPTDLHTVDHKNKIRDDNRLSNLQWKTPTEQRLNQERITTSNLSRKIFVKLPDGTSKECRTVTEASEFCNKSYTQVKRYLSGYTSIPKDWEIYHLDTIDLEGEEWRLVLSKDDGWHKNIYASNLGRVRFGDEGRMSYGTQLPDNYRQTCTMKDKVKMNLMVHRLVAMAFCGGRTELNDVVNHKNGEKGDNRSANLEWTDSKGNTVHAVETGLMNNFIPIVRIDKFRNVTHYPSVKSAQDECKIPLVVLTKLQSPKTRHGFFWFTKEEFDTFDEIPIPYEAKSRIRKVYSIDDQTGARIDYDSISEAARANNIAKSGISYVLAGKGNTANGKKWFYEDGLPSKWELLQNQ